MLLYIHLGRGSGTIVWSFWFAELSSKGKCESPLQNQFPLSVPARHPPCLKAVWSTCLHAVKYTTLHWPLFLRVAYEMRLLNLG